MGFNYVELEKSLLLEWYVWPIAWGRSLLCCRWVTCHQGAPLSLQMWELQCGPKRWNVQLWRSHRILFLLSVQRTSFLWWYLNAESGTVSLMCVYVNCCFQGSAVFWYNLFPSGEGDYSTRHAACPVLVGNKWGEPTCLSLHPLILPYYLHPENFRSAWGQK